MTRERTYGSNQPRTLRLICSSVQGRCSGGTAGPIAESSSGYCGNTGSGSVAPLGSGGVTGSTECRSNSLIVTSMRNAGGTAAAIESPLDGHGIPEWLERFRHICRRWPIWHYSRVDEL